MEQPIEQPIVETPEEARQYIENFWIPSVGSNVRFRRVASSATFQIERIDPKYPEQVTLRGRSQVAYIQDLEWVPSKSEIINLLERIGIKMHGENIQLGKAYRPMPVEYTEVAETLRTYRQVQLLTNEVDPYLAMIGP